MGIIKRYATEDYVAQEISELNIPTKVSSLENDVGYLTEHQDLSNYYTKTEANDLHDDLNEYVDAEVASLVNSAPETLDTLGELAEAFKENQEVVEVLNTAIADKVNKAELFDLIYPVGAIYLSITRTNPSLLFGGTWQQIKDRFLLAAGNDYIAGNTGGEAAHTLTNAEIPSVNGSITMHHAAIGTNINEVAGCFSGDSIVQGAYRQGGTLLNADTKSVGKINFSNGGEGQAHNNMPPYLVVYMWQRVS